MAQKFGEKPETTGVESTKATLAELVNQGFIKLPVAGVYVGNFMTELAQEYVRLRNDKPDESKLNILKQAVENTRATTSNVLLNKDTAPTASASISVVDKLPSAFIGSRSITKYLEKLA
jgi:hypothetical protein